MQLEGRFLKIAHDPGDPQITSHCPFCGSGQVTGRSDGTIDCAFCGMNYIVRVQPAFPGMPQQVMGPGALTDTGPEMGPGGMGDLGAGPMGEEGMPPGMEGEEEAPPFGGEDDEDGGNPFDGGEDEDGGEEGPPGGDEGEGPPPPPKPKKSKGSDAKGKQAALYRTLAGDLLPEASYLRHLAVLCSGGSPEVMARLRAEAEHDQRSRQRAQSYRDLMDDHMAQEREQEARRREEEDPGGWERSGDAARSPQHVAGRRP